MKLTSEQSDELLALRAANDALKGPSFQHICNHDFYRPLAAAGLVEIGGAPKGFDPAKFIGVTITEAGRAALTE